MLAPLEARQVEHVEAVHAMRRNAPGLCVHGDDPLGGQVPQELHEGARLLILAVAVANIVTCCLSAPPGLNGLSRPAGSQCMHNGFKLKSFLGHLPSFAVLAPLLHLGGSGFFGVLNHFD